MTLTYYLINECHFCQAEKFIHLGDVEYFRHNMQNGLLNRDNFLLLVRRIKLQTLTYPIRSLSLNVYNANYISFIEVIN